MTGIQLDGMVTTRSQNIFGKVQGLHYLFLMQLQDWREWANYLHIFIDVERDQPFQNQHSCIQPLPDPGGSILNLFFKEGGKTPLLFYLPQ